MIKKTEQEACTFSIRVMCLTEEEFNNLDLSKKCDKCNKDKNIKGIKE